MSDGFLGLRRPVVGMIHAPALPGAPEYGGSMDAVLTRARRDARALVAGGVSAVLVENYGDRPFFKDRVPPETVAGLTAVALAVREEIGRLPLGINCLRNDARAALGVAAAARARFIRVNVHTGTLATDQGLIEGAAAATLRERPRFAPDVLIVADVLVKHASPLVATTLEEAARDAVERGMADALIVTGPRTGAGAARGDVERVKAAVPDVPVLVGSGVSRSTVAAVLDVADGAIVGTAFERGGRTAAPVDVRRVRALMAAARKN